MPIEMKVKVEQVFCKYCRGKIEASDLDRELCYHAECMRLFRGDVLEDDFKVLVALEDLIQKNFIEFTDTSFESPSYEVEEGRIVSLVISGEPLGTFPEVITELNHLRFLSLDNCKIEMLPESIGKLKKLEKLILNVNSLTMLPEAITELVNLTDLSIYVNRLERLPESFGGLINLEFLDISRNRLDSLPKSLANLQNFKTLTMGYNKFKTIPEVIGNLSSLEHLNLEMSGLKTLPDFMVKLKTLRSLSVRRNLFETVPDVINRLPLKVLNLTGNRLLGDKAKHYKDNNTMFQDLFTDYKPDKVKDYDDFEDGSVSALLPKDHE